MTNKTTHSKSKAFFSRHPDILVCLLLVILTLSVFLQVKNHGFINFDDDQYVTDNRHVQSGLTLKGITWAFTATHMGNWHPLTWLSHMLDCQLFEMNPGWHHLTNLFLHIINILLLFIVLKKMTGNLWQSGLVASLFALHPLHVESVAWISERKDVLSTLFWMLTMWSYIYYVKSPGAKRYLSVLLFLTLGLMSKPMLVTIPFVLILLDYWPLNRIQIKQTHNDRSAINWSSVRRVFIEKIPLFLLVAISSMVTFLAQKYGGAVSSLDAIPVNIRVANALISYGAYIVKMIWPSNMAVLYPFPRIIEGWKIVLSCIFLISISYLSIRAIKKYPYFTVGWFWYIGTLVPVIGMVQVGRQAMADRYTYIPLIGIFIIISWGISEIITRWSYIKTALIAITTVILFILMPITFSQVRHWKSSITLFEHTLDVTYNNYMPHYNLGVVLQNQGRIDEAIEHYSEALRIKPDYEKAHNNLGVTLQDQGRIDEAIEHYLEALRIKPDFEEAHNNLGAALKNQGRIEEAIEHYLEALRIKPDSEKAHYNLGVALKDQGRIDEAIEHYSEALRIKPDFEEAHNNLGVTLFRKGDIDRAIACFRKVLEINPNSINAKNNLNKLLMIKGQGKLLGDNTLR